MFNIVMTNVLGLLLVCQLTNGALASSALDIDDPHALIPHISGEKECHAHCIELNSCQDWYFENSCCTVVLHRFATLQGASDRLLQTGNCDVWMDPGGCGMQVNTVMYGECEFVREPGQCLGSCSRGCHLMPDACEASCQPEIDAEFQFNDPLFMSLLLQSMTRQEWLANLRVELAAYLGVPEENVVLGIIFEGPNYVIVRVIILPIEAHQEITDIFAISLIPELETNSIDNNMYPILATLDSLHCDFGCNVDASCISDCITLNIAEGQPCDVQVDICGNTCADPCLGTYTCYSGECSGNILQKAVDCSTERANCMASLDGKCDPFVSKYLNMECTDVDFKTCYGGSIGDDGFILGLDLLMCIGSDQSESCSAPVICKDRQRKCNADATGGCVDLIHAVLFDDECPEVYGGPGLELCYLGQDVAAHSLQDGSYRLAVEYLACLHNACRDTCAEIGGVPDPFNVVCLTPCESGDDSCTQENIDEVHAAGNMCSEAEGPPCSLTRGPSFAVTYSIGANPHTLCQEIRNMQPDTDSFFIRGTFFDTSLFSGVEVVRSEVCKVFDDNGDPVRYQGIKSRRDPMGPENFIEIAGGQGSPTVSACVDLVENYMLRPGFAYTAECPLKVLSYEDALTVHTNYVGFNGPMELMHIQGPVVLPDNLLSVVQLLEMADRKRIWRNNTAKYLLAASDCAPDQFSGCTSGEESGITSKYASSCSAVEDSSVYSDPDPDNSITKKYFSTGTGLSDMQAGMIKIREILEYGTRIVCRPSGCDSDTYAYVNPDSSTHTINLCDIYWEYSDEKVVTIVHEASHFTDIADTDDKAYGCDPCLDLSSANAIVNADSWGFYVDDFCEDECFSDSSVIITEHRGDVPLRDILIGEKVLAIDKDGAPFFDEVYFLAHFHPLVGSERLTTLLRINFENHEYVEVSRKHLVYAQLEETNQTSVGTRHCMALNRHETICTHQADEITPGSVMYLHYATGLESRVVTKIETIRDQFRNINTLGGNVIVNNVLVSCYERDHILFHSEFAIIRVLYEYFPSCYKIIYPLVYVHIEYAARLFQSLTGNAQVGTWVVRTICLAIIIKLITVLKKR